MSSLLIVTRHGEVRQMLPWAVRLSRTRSGSLMVLCIETGHPIHPLTRMTTDNSASDPLMEEARTAIRDLSVPNAELWYLRDPHPSAALVKEAENRKVELLLVAAPAAPTRHPLASDIAGKMLRDFPSDTFVLDPAAEAGEEIGRIVVPMGGRMVAEVLKTAAAIAGRSGAIVPLLVGPQFGTDSRAVTRRELEAKLRDLPPEVRKSDLIPEVVVAEKALSGIARAAQKADLVLIGASSTQVLSRLRKTMEMEREEAEPDRCAIAVFRPAAVKPTGILAGRVGRLTGWLPRLDPTERIRLFDRLYEGVRFNRDFLVMMGLSTAIATLGLLQGSTAVVIGAMLVAPLMIPLIGAGFALVQGNLRLFGTSMKAMGFGIAVGLALSIGIGAIAPKTDLPIEVVLRAAPSLLDFFVALFSGMAAAYAFARPGLLGTLAGVAIAAALVPPLASVGIGLSRQIYPVAKGAAILHLLNLVSIILGAGFVFLTVGVQGTRLGIGRALWVRRAVLLLLLSTVLLVAPLGYEVGNSIRKSQPRPVAFPLSTTVLKAITDRVDLEEGIDLILAGKSSFVEEERLVGILLAAEGPVKVELKIDLRNIVKKNLGADTIVKVWVIQSAELE